LHDGQPGSNDRNGQNAKSQSKSRSESREQTGEQTAIGLSFSPARNFAPQFLPRGRMQLERLPRLFAALFRDGPQ
jgi:hypothetical protein